MPRRIAFSLIVILIFASFGLAQTNDEGLAFLQFSFVNPGARALGMGGAFIGLADDATAAFANPAGLTVLSKPEVNLQFSVTDFSNEIPWNSGTLSNHIEMTANEIRQFDYSFLFEPRDFSASLSDLSFASVVYPVRPQKLVLSGFFNRQTRFKRDFSSQPFSRNVSTCTPNCVPLNGVNSFLDFKIDNFGVSISSQLQKKFSLGFTLSYSTLRVDSLTERVDNLSSLPEFVETLNGDDGSVSFSAGVLVKVNQAFSVGSIYSRRPTFDVTSSAEPIGVTPSQARARQFKVPDSLGLGFSWKPTKTVRLNGDFVHLFYSQLMDRYYNAFEHNNPFVQLSEFEPDFQKGTLEVEDGTEFHFGGEYIIFFGSRVFAIRAGYWREPFHSMINTVEDADLEVILSSPGRNVLNDTLARPWYSRSLIQDIHHIAFGMGLVIGPFTIDGAYDYSDNAKRFILSTVWHI